MELSTFSKQIFVCSNTSMTLLTCICNSSPGAPCTTAFLTSHVPPIFCFLVAQQSITPREANDAKPSLSLNPPGAASMAEAVANAAENAEHKHDDNFPYHQYLMAQDDVWRGSLPANGTGNSSKAPFNDAALMDNQKETQDKNLGNFSRPQQGRDPVNSVRRSPVPRVDLDIPHSPRGDAFPATVSVAGSETSNRVKFNNQAVACCDRRQTIWNTNHRSYSDFTACQNLVQTEYSLLPQARRGRLVLRQGYGNVSGSS